MTLQTHARDAAFRVIVGPVGRVLARAHVTPNVITTMGIVLTSISAALVVAGHPYAGGIVLVFGGLSDTFDGPVARITGRVTRFGAFYDSVSDRLCDAITLLAVAWLVRGDATRFTLVAVAMTSAQLTSYVRAKAESMDWDCNLGLVERAERGILLMYSLLLFEITYAFDIVMWLLALGGTFTVFQRLVHVWRQARPA